MAGDIITQLDGQSAQGLSYYQMAERLRGQNGTTLRLPLVRPGREKQLELSLVRTHLDTHSVRVRIEGGDVGYIRVAQFDDQTATQLKQAIADIAAQVPADQLKGYVIDLRNDPGGPLEAALPVANELLDSGEIVAIR